jgi:hypothetical protein
MASVEQNLRARLPWTRLWKGIALLVGLVAALVTAMISLNAQTTPGRHGRMETPSAASLALPCRHQMTVSRQAPACSAPSAADITPGYVASRKPHGFGRGHLSRGDCLGLPRRGWVCPAPSWSSSKLGR